MILLRVNAMIPFYYHPRMLEYDFGKGHPLKPERLRRTFELVQQHTQVEILDPGLCPENIIALTHSIEYIEFIKSRSDEINRIKDDHCMNFGFGYGDCPYFPNAHLASQSYCGGSLQAARAVNDGASVAISLSGGLHHAQHAKASGFCIYNDAVIAIKELQKKYKKIAYIDIDVHHGDGVEMLMWEDANVLTCSIHQDGRTLYPGTGFVTDTPASGTSVNLGLLPESTANVWLNGFNDGILPAVKAFRPDAIVVQSGTDAHLWDPLAGQRLRSQDWLSAVSSMRNLDLPAVVLGGGGYHLECVPRMWLGAVCIWSGCPIPGYLGEVSRSEWNMPTIEDSFAADEFVSGETHVESQIDYIKRVIIPKLATV